MNRSITFRGKTLQGEWVYGSYIPDYLGSQDFIFYTKNGKRGKVVVIRETVGQFTGMLDQYDKGIYEGDFCQAHKPNSYLDGIYLVAWHDTKGRWHYVNQPKYKDLYQVGCSGNLKCKVVGNLHDNPELLKSNER
jgi:hypothetical protein